MNSKKKITHYCCNKCKIDLTRCCKHCCSKKNATKKITLVGLDDFSKMVAKLLKKYETNNR